MSDAQHDSREDDEARAVDPGAEGHPSQAEGEDPDDVGGHEDPQLDGHPSQAEGEKPGDAR